ncbi:F0F1 ATP synthase subunit delta [Radiobacillus kanasensis]|uniref:F0F1 ATP synthase subunit delta n=1 Tax=Radiobacillus kanasensis TaxID=2844358 RepID=UPI001E46341E|nr:F0F1 ATP synthase subunit delta [Radiobacillus kanasensis]UFT98947.1 F0F1 ATP synthase subunit delta [Radiobacillus kanasensis]
MSEAVVSKRYADALFQLAQEKSRLVELEEEIRALDQIVKQSPELLTFLTNPKVSASDKKNLLKESLKDFSSEVIHTLFILVDRHREEIIPDVISHFIQLANEQKGIAEAKVYSVRELSIDEQEEISKVFAKKLNINVLKIENIVDPSIIGGIKIRVGNTIYDGSISGKLTRLERSIVSAN